VIVIDKKAGGGKTDNKADGGKQDHADGGDRGSESAD